MKNIINIFIILSILLINGYSNENHVEPNFFELFGLEKSNQEEIFRTGSLYLKYTPKGLHTKPMVRLMLDGRALCLFCFHLDENDKIVESGEMIYEDSVVVHCYALRKYEKNPIIRKLVQYFHYDLDNCSLKWQDDKLVERVIKWLDNLDADSKVDL